jgi:hypothetical protein
MYQTRPPLVSSLNMLCHSQLLGIVIVNGLWYVYLGVIQSLFCKMCSDSMSLDFSITEVC